MKFLTQKLCQKLPIYNIESDSESYSIKIKSEVDTNIRRKIKSYILELSVKRKENKLNEEM